MNDNIYNIPDNKSNRYTIQGFGQRGGQFISKNKFTPSPLTYIINSLFDYNARHNRGFTMLGKSAESNTRKHYPGV